MIPVRPPMINLKVTVRNDCSVSACGLLLLFIKALAPLVAGVGGVGLWTDICVSPTPLSFPPTWPGDWLLGSEQSDPPTHSFGNIYAHLGAWWASVYGVAQRRTRLKRLSSCSSILTCVYVFLNQIPQIVTMLPCLGIILFSICLSPLPATPVSPCTNFLVFLKHIRNLRPFALAIPSS